jgi:hypothetical protein
MSAGSGTIEQTNEADPEGPASDVISEFPLANLTPRKEQNYL